MSYINKTVTIYDSVLFLGMQGSHDVLRFAFDLSPWTDEIGESGDVVISAKRSGDEIPYIVAGVEYDAGIARWVVSVDDTAYAGEGTLQVDYTTVNGGLIRSKIYRTVTAQSMGAADPEPADYETWYNTFAGLVATATHAAREAEDFATTATAAAGAAAQAASDADESETNAANSADAAAASAGAAAASETAAAGSAESAAGSAAQVAGEAAQIAQNTADITDLKADFLQSLIYDTASGAVATFPDGAHDLPCKSVVAQIVPVQDLHGQDGPWPAGGGKNLFNKDSFTALDNVYFNKTNTKIANGGGNKGFIAPCKSDTSYTISFQVKNHTDIQLASFDDVPAVGSASENYRIIGTSDTSKAVTITTGASDRYLFVKYNILNATQTYTNDQILAGIQLEEGATATAWTPYSNICPISGHTQAVVTRTGKNLWNPVAKTNAFLAPSIGSPLPVLSVDYSSFSEDVLIVNAPSEWTGNGFISNPLLVGKTYRITGSIDATAPRVQISVLDDKKMVARNIQNLTTTGDFSITVTIATGERYIAIALVDASNGHIEVKSPCISESGDYEPYSGTSLNIQLGQTVYGGQVDVVSGEGKVTYGMVDLGTLTWSAISTDTAGKNRFMADVSGIKIGDYTKVKLICSEYKEIGLTVTYGLCGVAPHGTVAKVFVADPVRAEMTGAEFKSAMSGVLLVYELATPTDFSVTPQEVSTLYGSNTVYADSGDVSVEYPADTKLYISRLTGPDSADMIADANIVSEKYFMVGNDLYLATSNIANGGSIIPGTNCTKVSLATALNAINS